MLNNDYGISEINMDGFQVVRGQLFSRMLEPFMSIWYSSISFNAACYSALNECAAIQLLVNSHDRRVLVNRLHHLIEILLTGRKNPISINAEKLNVQI